MTSSGLAPPGRLPQGRRLIRPWRGDEQQGFRRKPAWRPIPAPLPHSGSGRALQCGRGAMSDHHVLIKTVREPVSSDGQSFGDHADPRPSQPPVPEASGPGMGWACRRALSRSCHLLRFLQQTTVSPATEASASRSHSVICELSPVCGRMDSMAGSEVTLSPN